MSWTFSIAAANNASTTEPKTIKVDAAGDITIVAGEYPNQLRLVVCRDIVARACEVWKVMLKGQFAEASKSQIPLPDDDPQALLIIFDIIHLKFSLVPRELSCQQLFNLAILLDKYALHGIINPYGFAWVSNLIGTYKNGREELLFIAWVFGYGNEFKHLAKRIAHESKGPGGASSIERLRGLYMPSTVTDDISDNRVRTLAAILTLCRKRIDSPYHGKGEERVCHHYRKECHAWMLGSFMQCMQDAELWPIPDVSNFKGSVEDLRKILEDLDIKELISRHWSEDHSKCVSRFWSASSIQAAIDSIQPPFNQEQLKSIEANASLVAGTFTRQF